MIPFQSQLENIASVVPSREWYAHHLKTIKEQFGLISIVKETPGNIINLPHLLNLYRYSRDSVKLDRAEQLIYEILFTVCEATIKARTTIVSGAQHHYIISQAQKILVAVMIEQKKLILAKDEPLVR